MTRSRLLAGVATAAGCAALVVRPLVLPAGAAAAWATAALFAVLLGLGLWWPTDPAGTGRVHRMAVLAAGLGAFAASRAMAGDPAVNVVPRVVLLLVIAAVAEEAFFRRLVYGALLPAGAAVAVLGSAGLFAIVHVTVYGWWVLPLDLAAGLVLSWQRWASGTWTVPAVAHVGANLLVIR